METYEWVYISNKKNNLKMHVSTSLSDFYILLAFLTVDMLCSSNERGIEAASEVNHKHLENMIIDMPGLDIESEPSKSKKDKKVKKRQKQRKKSSSETEGL